MAARLWGVFVGTEFPMLCERGMMVVCPLAGQCPQPPRPVERIPSVGIPRSARNALSDTAENVDYNVSHHSRGKPMNASIVDLRYKMKDVLRALARGERVTILYRGKAKGVLVPVEAKPRGRVARHPFFGMTAVDTRSVTAEMETLRGGRFRAL